MVGVERGEGVLTQSLSRASGSSLLAQTASKVRLTLSGRAEWAGELVNYFSTEERKTNILDVIGVSKLSGIFILEVN